MADIFYVIIILFITGCSSAGFKQDAYEGLYARQCIKDIGLADCDTGQMSYDAYKTECDRLLN
jgi:hypothetical protein